ncbi:MAG: rhodanese-related sulfurtransferase [Pontiellaceae bacterium]
MNKYTVCALYKFINFNNLKLMKNEIYNFLTKNKIKGTIIIAEEGINGTVCGSSNSIKKLLTYLIQKYNLNEIDNKISYHKKNPFYRTKVRIKKEIVTIGSHVNPNKFSGIYVEPKDWNNLISDNNTILIDTRNEYEIGIGSFKNSINPHTNSFREIPNFLDKKFSNEDKCKKIAMFCTGGIRCEKSTAYLKKNGFENVYHLKGGILNYLKKINSNNSLWEGECFVFDNRVSVTHDLVQGEFDQCHACRIPISHNDKKSIYYEKGVSCPYCYQKTTHNKKLKFKERQMQIELAKKRGTKHLGINHQKDNN